jgi:hypothetical protein
VGARERAEEVGFGEHGDVFWHGAVWCARDGGGGGEG